MCVKEGKTNYTYFLGEQENKIGFLDSYRQGLEKLSETAVGKLLFTAVTQFGLKDV